MRAARADSGGAALRRADDHGYVEQKLLLGTHTSEDEDNHLLVAKVCLPADESDVAMDTGDGKQGRSLGASRHAWPVASRPACC